MSDSEHYINIAEYGNWLYGYIPTEEVTAVIYYKGRFIDSYIGEHTPYRDTPLKSAIESYVSDSDAELRVPEGRYYSPERDEEFHHSEGELVSALVGIPHTAKEYKTSFKRKIAAGEVQFSCPVLVNRFGDLYTHEDYLSEVREKFMEYAIRKNES